MTLPPPLDDDSPRPFTPRVLPRASVEPEEHLWSWFAAGFASMSAAILVAWVLWGRK